MKVSVSFSDASHAQTALSAIRKFVPDFSDNILCDGQSLGYVVDGVDQELAENLVTMFKGINPQIKEHGTTFNSQVTPSALVLV